MKTHWHWSGRIIAAAALALVALAPARADDPPGILWDTTSQMTMADMPLTPPPQNLQLCAPKVWTKPPPGGDPTCVNSDFKIVGNKVTWTMQCSGDMPMTGAGELTFNGTESYTGVIRMQASGMNMQVNLTGKKIGTCDNPD